MAAYNHLPIRRLEGTFERRKKPGFGSAPKREKEQHGAAIQAEIDSVVRAFEDRPKISGVNPDLILKIQLSNRIPEEDWAQLGLTVLANAADKSFILFADDTELQEFKRRIEAYQGAPLPSGTPRYASLINNIEQISEVTPEDRIGEVLRAEGIGEPADFPDEKVEVLDVELWPLDEEKKPLSIFKVEQKLAELNGELLSEYRGSAAVLIRIRASGATIKQLLQMSEISTIDRPPQPDLPSLDEAGFTVEDFEPVIPPNEEAPTIGVIDSGLSQNHPLLGQVVRGGFGVPQSLGDDDEKGHGTPVSGIAVYGDVRQQLAIGQFAARFRVASAKVVNRNGRFDDTELVTAQMETAIRRLANEYGCKVINISLADSARPVASKPSAWAAVLDQLARELDLVIVVSAGNSEGLSARGAENIRTSYPKYLIEDFNHILEPASAINVLTVGSLAHTNGISAEDELTAAVRPISKADQPSPFTRTGPGIGKMIKPDLVDYGGTLVFDGAIPALQAGRHRPAAGVVSLHHRYITDGRLFCTNSGTSFSAPLVAYKAALLREAFPQSSANLVRSLLAVSAEVPQAAQECLNDFNDSESRYVLGYGLPNIGDALASDDNRVVLYAEDALQPDRFAVYSIPIPLAFQTTVGHKQIRVALAFDPPTRHTRIDYAGLSMAFKLFRGTTADEVFNACRKWEKKTEGDPFKLAKRFECNLTPNQSLRERGTLQCAEFVAKNNIEQYGDQYFLAIQCKGGWAQEIVDQQRFAISIQLRHEADIQLYQQIRARVRLRT